MCCAQLTKKGHGTCLYSNISAKLKIYVEGAAVCRSRNNGALFCRPLSNRVLDFAGLVNVEHCTDEHAGGANQQCRGDTEMLGRPS